VRLSPLGMSATSGPIVSALDENNDGCGAGGRMKIGRGNRSTRIKPPSVLLCPPTQIPHALEKLSIYGSTTLVGLGRLFSFLIPTQSVGLLGRRISPSQGRYLHTEPHNHRINADRHPCLDWDSNPQSQCSRWRRWFMP
jgi:hypothetical protein